MKRIYLDNSATTPISPEVIEAMTEAMKINYGNPSSIHSEGRTSRALIEQSRKVVAQYIGASIGEIFFTSGGTESSNMALKCAVRDLGVRRIISSRIEHHCVLHSLDTLAEKEGVKVEWVELDEQGHVNIAHLKELLQNQSEKTMVSLMHANNEVGTMIDLDEISQICEENGAFFHTDTVQTVGFYPINVNETKVSFMTGSAHKFNGPKGSGFIYINGDNIIKPFVDGGSQERKMRAGTENLYGIVGLAKALELSCDNMEPRKKHVKELRDYMMRLLEENFEDIEFLGDPKERGAYKVLSVAFAPCEKSELLLLNLDIAGVSASGGSACTSGAEAGSHVVSYLKGAEFDRKVIRFSFGYQNTKEEVDYVVEKLKSILPQGEPAS